jgi:hypothetical protein
MKEKITIALTSVVVLTLVGIISSQVMVGSTFNAVSRELGTGYGGGGAPMEAPAAPAPMQLLSDSGLSYEQSSVAPNVVETERMVIENADLSIVVADPKARMQEIAEMVKGMGGFVVSSNIFQTSYGPNNIEVPEASMTIRVPSERLDEALEKIKEGAVDVTYENRSGQDVTSAYVDLQSRLAAKQAAEKKLLEIMNGAVKTEDVLAVYAQLQMIQSEIEVLKGQIKYYDESVALSAVSIRLIAEETVKPVEIGGWKLQGAANDAVQDLILFAQGFTRFLIRFVLYVLPALILIGIPLYGAFVGGRALFRRFRKSKAVVEVKEEEKK